MNKFGRLRPRTVFILLSGVTFLAFLDTNLLIPIISLFVSGLGAGTATIGLIVGMYSIINTPANLVSGRLIDRFGYRAPLITGLVISAASMFSYSLAGNPFHLALVRAFHGIGGGLTSPATMSAVTAHSRQIHRGRAMSFYGMSIALANLVGFALSGVIVSRFGYMVLFWFGSGMLVLGMIFSLLLPGAAEQTVRTGGNAPGFRQVKSLLQRRGLIVSYSTIFAQYFAFGGLVTLLPLYVVSLGLEAFHVGMMLSAFTIMFIAVQFPAGGISDRIGRMFPVIAGLGLGSVSLVILPSLTAFPLLLAAMAAFGMAFGILFPSVSALVSDQSAPGELGLASGIFHGLITTGVAVGAIAIGWVGEAVGVRQGLQIAPAVMVPALAVTLIAMRHR